ncbi:MAG: hypothetical protein KGL39_54615 [Patescibacteria group bacterium]|nr:hypothetical protein [Patescibacteria group bacterium]
MHTVVFAVVVTIVVMLVVWALYTMSTDMQAPGRFFRSLHNDSVYDTLGDRSSRTATGAEVLWGLLGMIVIFAIIGFVATNI